MTSLRRLSVSRCASQVQETHFVMLVDLLIAVPAFVVCLAFVALVVDLGLPW